MSDARIAFCDIRFLLPSISSPVPVSVNRTAADLATNNNKRKQLQERKLNIPADADDDRECVREVCRPLQAL